MWIKTGRSAEDLPTLVQRLVKVGVRQYPPGERLYDRVISAVERELIGQVMQQCDHVQVKAAQRLGMNRNTLHQKLKEFSAGEAENVE